MTSYRKHNPSGFIAGTGDDSMRTALLLMVMLSPTVAADDWPCWRGRNHTGVSAETRWLDVWPADGPKVPWRANVGTGFAAVAVSRGRLYTLGNTDDTDTVYCLDAATGREVWRHAYESPRDPNMFDGGPTATPAVDGDRLYTLGRRGELICFEAATGKVVWSFNVVQLTSQRVPTWGLAGSPVVHDKLLLLNLGDAGVALDKATGKLLWNSDVKDPGYSSPLPFRRGDEWFAVFSSEDEYVATNLRTGKALWRVPWPTRYGVNAADPILDGDTAFVSAGYNKGAGLWNVAGEPAAVWQSKVLRNQINSSVRVGGFLYGVDGDTASRAKLRCVEWATGTVKWDEESVGCGSLTAAGGKLLVLSERGELLTAPATPERFRPTARAKVLTGKCWTVPVLSGGRVFCRNADGDLVCIDLNAPP